MRRRAFRFVLVTVAVPLAGYVATEAAEALERRRGATPLTRGIRRAGESISSWRSR